MTAEQAFSTALTKSGSLLKTEKEFVEADAEGTVNGLLHIECEVRQRGKLHTGSFSIGTIRSTKTTKTCSYSCNIF